MASGAEALRNHVRRLRELGTLAADAAPDLADAVEGEVRAQIARGEAPDGTRWQLTQDGRRPLQSAGESLTVRALGSVVILRVVGHHARHHLGAVKGGVKRQILPTARIPAPMVRALTTTLTMRFREVTSS